MRRKKGLVIHAIIRFIKGMAHRVKPQQQNDVLKLDARDCASIALRNLQAVPEESLWLANNLSPHTRRAYRQDVGAFMQFLGIRSRVELRAVNRAAVLAWRNDMMARQVKPRTIRRCLSALSSLFKHLVAHQAADTNPVREISRPRVNRRHGTTRAFSKREARKILDAPSAITLQGLRDRAILSVGLQAGPRRAEIAGLLVRDFHTNAGYKSLHLIRKGNEDHSLALNPQTVQRIEDYLAAAGHRSDLDGPLFRPVRTNQFRGDLRRHLHAEAIDRILQKYVTKLGLDNGYSAHSMRATFITTALNNGANLEDVQRDVGHADPNTTKLYDRRGHNPERSASFFAVY